MAYQNRYTYGRPRLAGLHLQIEPASGYALAVNRQMQFGGGERGQDGFNNFVHALFNPTKYDNMKSSTDYDREFGNQQASLTSRVVFPGNHPFALYFEYAGEDTSRFSNYLLGNVSFSAGIDIPDLWDRFGLTFETTEWQNAWYVHHIYLDGLTNHGVVVGNRFGDQRRFNDSVGGMSNMLRLDWQLKNGSSMQGIYRILKNNSSDVFDYQRMQELGVGYSFPWQHQTIGAQLYAGKDVFGKKYARLNASIDFLQGKWSDAIDSFSIDTESDDSTEIIADIGMTYYKIVSDLGIDKDSTKRSSGVNTHAGLGARRSVSEHSDLGARIEWDRLAGHDLISARMLDYRYRFGNHFAWSSFFGVGRYNYGAAAYGWYMGMGPQITNILSKWDLCIEGRYFKKMVRDKVLKSDPVTNSSRPYVFDAGGITVYMSRRF
jgi:hypothetical protein